MIASHHWLITKDFLEEEGLEEPSKEEWQKSTLGKGTSVRSIGGERTLRA
jgi:hypothetical protein